MGILQVQGRLWFLIHYPIVDSSELPEMFASAEIIIEEQLKKICYPEWTSDPSTEKIRQNVKLMIWQK
jgi:hypothetical protein